MGATGVRDAIERAGHSTDDVIVDFLSFDADNPVFGACSGC